jgi:hypothetical protein
VLWSLPGTWSLCVDALDAGPEHKTPAQYIHEINPSSSGIKIQRVQVCSSFFVCTNCAHTYVNNKSRLLLVTHNVLY